MIRYTLACDQGHSFDSWFKSSAAFDALRAAGHLECPVCGTARVDKALMAPAVAKPSPAASLASPTSELEARLRALRAHLDAHSDDVGRDFADEARRMHLGEVPERPIHGQARLDEARALIEDGVPVLPLPFSPSKTRN